MKKSSIRDIALIMGDVIHNRKVLNPRLTGGLCNKLYCLMSACEIAQKKNYKVLEPQFGWKSKMNFSEIYDIDYFNLTMKELTGVENIMISSRQEVSEKDIIQRSISLWDYSQKNIRRLRENNIIYQDSMMVYLMKSLKLKKQYQDIVFENLSNFLAVQIRIESDWVTYSNKVEVSQNETLLIDLDKLIEMVIEFNSPNKIFFTTGENHQYIKDRLSEKGIESSFFYDPSLEYEINAAINFEILSHSKKFIGLSRSTFSNLITLKRQLLLNKNENYIYNYGEKIHMRSDYGLYPSAFESINKNPSLK